MCGIAGIMTSNGAAPDRAALAAMQKALAHRGPDGEGMHVGETVGMVHTRLAIIDLETGDQPLYEPGGAALVANGEIYNNPELRAAMPDTPFTTRSDCEPPLHLYRRDGLDFADALRGMYALAIHDPDAGRLVLARDPFGIKPLYYAQTAAGFAFASEPAALIAGGIVAPALRVEGAAELLQLQFTTGRETAFAGIERVLPGETLVVAGGRIVERRRRSILSEDGPEPLDEAEALRRLDAALTDSVTVHQRSDVPYGMFLSGGIDSSAILALMARLNDRPVRAFTVGFPGTGVADERAHARRVARSLGADHVEIAFGKADFWRLLPRVAAAMDDPAADYAVLPTFRLAEEVGRDLKVVLSGEGGDELFAGYGRYRAVMRPWWRGGRTMRSRGVMDGLGVLRRSAPAWRDGVAASIALEARGGRSRLQAAQAVDCADWLPNDLLNKVDRCLMVHGVEGRTPMLDPAVAAIAYRLPDRLKVRDGMGKWLLRRWLDKAAPQADPFTRKRGFTVPVGEWVSEHGARLGPLVAAQPGINELCEPAGVVRAFRRADTKRAGFAAWNLLFFALWHNRHILGREAGGDVFEQLAG